MKEPKPYLLTLVSVFLLISVGLLATAIYLYFNKPSLATVTNTNKKIAVKTLSNTRDSLEKVYTAAIKDLDASFAPVPGGYAGIADSQVQANNRSGRKINDTSATLEKLQKEISSILSDKSAAADLELAKTKISELQNLVDNLKNKNYLITKENERLNYMLKQVTGNTKKSEPAYKTNNEQTDTKIKPPSVSLKAENLQVWATASADFIEKETTAASGTDRIDGSFTVITNGTQNTVMEIIVVVLQPDGKVLQTSNWENGIFYTSAGKQIYSKKLRFNNNDAATKKLNFSLQAEKYSSGKYIIELYYAGVIIGRTTKILF